MRSSLQLSFSVLMVLIVAILVAGCAEESDKTLTRPAATTPTMTTTPKKTIVPTTQPDDGRGKLEPIDAFLTISLDKDGKGAGKPVMSELECASEFESKNQACLALADNPAMLAPEKSERVCTSQYGGPETATVKGTVNGKAVSASFSRTDGCQIARWDAANALWEKNS